MKHKRHSLDEERLKYSEERKESQKKYQSSLSELISLKRQLEAVTHIRNAKDSFVIRKQSKNSRKTEATAVVLISDTHLEELVTKEMTNGLNEFNPTIAKERTTLLFQRIIKLIEKEGQDVKINQILIWLGGDIITNSLREANLENNAFPPVEAAIFAKELLKSGLQFLRTNFKGKILVVCSTGNHGRLTKKVHYATETENSLETFIYSSLQEEVKGMDFVIEKGGLTYVKVYDMVIRFTHGHYVQYGGGIGGVTIPLIKAIRGWDTARKADLTCIGHFHSYLSHGFGKSGGFIVNGSLVGYNAYAVSIKASYEPPCQAFFLIDSKRGRTVQMPILLN